MRKSIKEILIDLFKNDIILISRDKIENDENTSNEIFFRKCDNPKYYDVTNPFKKYSQLGFNGFITTEDLKNFYKIVVRKNRILIKDRDSNNLILSGKRDINKGLIEFLMKATPYHSGYVKKIMAKKPKTKKHFDRILFMNDVLKDFGVKNMGCLPFTYNIYGYSNSVTIEIFTTVKLNKKYGVAKYFKKYKKVIGKIAKEDIKIIVKLTNEILI